MSLELIYTYNRLATLLVGSKRPQILTPSPNLIRMAEEMAEWLDENEFSSGPYLSSCFALHSWAWQPKFARLTLEKYRRNYQANEVEAALWWRQHELERKVNEPVALSAGREIVRARFRYDHKEKLCRAQPELSGGYNELSAHCKTCPEMEGCRAADNDADSSQQRAGPGR